MLGFCAASAVSTIATQWRTFDSTLVLALAAGHSSLLGIVFLQLTALLPVHSGFDLLELALAGKKLLSLLVDFSLHLHLDLAQLLLLAPQLLLLQTDRLAGKVFGVHG